MKTTTPAQSSARQQLRAVAARLEANAAERKMLIALRATTIKDASRRGLSNAAIADEVGLTKQRVGQVAAKTAASIAAVNAHDRADATR